MIFSPAHLSRIIPSNKEVPEWFQVLNELMPKYEINTLNRVAAFLAQCAHESMEFKALSENLNYSAEGLRKTWPKRFNATTAASYARQPQRIANKVYADRMGNGNEASGDGWRYRGGGLKQLTGKDNYTAFAKSVNMSIEQAAEYVRTKKGAAESACWFWKTNNLNKFADADDIVGMTVVINGGTNGLEDRKRRYENAKIVLRG